MELPHALASLYRHWDAHVAQPENHEGSLAHIPPQLHWFIRERLAIWEKKMLGAQPPFTTDPLLARYRFCNIFRECDKQTIAFHTLLNPVRDDFPLWLMNMFYCRMIARPETINHTGLLSYSPQENHHLYQRLITSPRPRFGTPYVFPVSTIHKSPTPTRELFLAHHVPRVMPAVAREITSWQHLSVVDGVARILPMFGFRLAFLWTEVLIDVAYQFPERISLFKPFPLGPGSLPTFRAIAPPKSDLCAFVHALGMARMPTHVTYHGKSLVLSAENWEGIGCEFRKYRNLAEGKGRRRLFVQ